MNTESQAATHNQDNGPPQVDKQQSSSVRPPSQAGKQSKSSKSLAKLHAKQARRRLKSDLLPDSSLGLDLDDYTTFANELRNSRRILALLGAGLSAASGIPTFRGAGGYWRRHDATQLATPEAFYNDPVTVWQFYHDRRVLALRAQPNRGHAALARLARRRGEDFLAITQNIDGLSERAGHADGSLLRLHGSLHEVKCSSSKCDYSRALEDEEELCPSLPVKNYQVYNGEDDDASASASVSTTEAKPVLTRDDLPKCPICTSLLRPTVVWFGEPLPVGARDRVHDWLDYVPKVDLMLVVGTSAVVFPAAAYIHAARVQGARIAVFNIEPPSEEDQENPITRLRDGVDWFFQGSAADTLSEVLKEAIGTIGGKVDGRGLTGDD